MSPSFHACMLPILNKIEKADKTGEIGLLSTLFSDAVSSVGTINTKTVHDLDVANILVWVSYTMYDSVIDEEHAAPTYTIAAANAVLRLAHSLYQSIDSLDIATQLLNTVDTAMLDEQLRNRKLRHTGVQLHTGLARTLSSEQSKKSIAHIAGPLIISNLLDLPHQELLTRSLGTYCEVRQLLDDIYDAKGDLDRNHYTYANTKLYPSLQLNSHDPQLQRGTKRTLMSEALTKSLEAIDALCENNGIEKDSNFTSATLGRIRTIATRALAYDAATSESIEAFISQGGDESASLIDRVSEVASENQRPGHRF